MVWPPILMVCSVTEDSSLAVAGSHFSAGFASGAFASRSGACAARRAACPSKTKIPTAHTQKLFFIRFLPLKKVRRACDRRNGGIVCGGGGGSQRKRSRGASGRERVYGWEDQRPSPTPGCFSQRAWNCMKTNGLSF